MYIYIHIYIHIYIYTCIYIYVYSGLWTEGFCFMKRMIVSRDWCYLRHSVILYQTCPTKPNTQRTPISGNVVFFSQNLLKLLSHTNSFAIALFLGQNACG